jgi:hypothetical protein
MVAFACYYNVLIASSGDTRAERERVFDTISEWNGGWGGTPRNVIFVPLMWEMHAISDADSHGPQDSINRQLLNRSDFVIAIFKGRIGMPTQNYPGGTIEELARRRGRAAVFFCDADRSVPSGADIDEWYKQQKALQAFRASFTGLSRNYKDPDDLSKKVRDQLDGWLAELADEQPETLLAMYPRPWKAECFAMYIDDDSQKLTLLIYNAELQGFRSVDSFNETWSYLESCESIRVCPGTSP